MAIGDRTKLNALSIRQRQIASIRQLINLNKVVVDSIAVEPQWKILLFDSYGQDILSPLLTVKDLRELGVTLHLFLDTPREQLPEVPAVYFCRPTDKNVKILCQDFSSGLYDHYYLNFIGSLPRPLLEDIANAAVSNSCIQQVAKVFDQFVNFISLEDDLFTLRRHNDDCDLSYYSINRPEMDDLQMNEIIENIVNGLFAACVTLCVVPIIRAPKGNCAEQVAQRLDKKIRDNLRDARNNLFVSEGIKAGQINFSRPVLLIMDRTFDLATMLHHTWTYQALVHDTLDLQLNRVTLKESESNEIGDQTKKKQKEYDLNVVDEFWLNNKGRPFPEVAESVQENLEKYRKHEVEIKRMKSAMGLSGEDDAAISMISDVTTKLTDTVSSLPELLEQKRLIDLHTNVATSVLEEIKARKLDIYFETEEKLLNKQQPEKSLTEIFSSEETGTKDDKLRLFLLYYMLQDCKTEADETKRLIQILRDAGCDEAAVKYVRQWKTFANMLSDDQYQGGGIKAVDMFSRLLNHSSQLVMEGVKNLVIKKHNLPLSRVVDAIMEHKQMQDVDDYCYFDPKLLRATDSSARSRQPFNDCIVFLIGGGNYVEYQNLIDYGKSRNAPSTMSSVNLAAMQMSGASNIANAASKRIIYGCTDLCNGQEFLRQLSRLGSEM